MQRRVARRSADPPNAGRSGRYLVVPVVSVEPVLPDDPLLPVEPLLPDDPLPEEPEPIEPELPLVSEPASLVELPEPMLPEDVLPEPVPPGVESLPVELVPGVAEEPVPLELEPEEPVPEVEPVEPPLELPLPDCANAPVAPASASAPANTIVYLIFIGPLSSLASAPMRSAFAPTA